MDWKTILSISVPIIGRYHNRAIGWLLKEIEGLEATDKSIEGKVDRIESLNKLRHSKIRYRRFEGIGKCK